MMNLRTSHINVEKRGYFMGKHVFENKVRNYFMFDDGGVFFTEEGISDYCSYGLERVQYNCQLHANFDLNTHNFRQ